jgi:TatA/E family protein of Tat protein translocase
MFLKEPSHILLLILVLVVLFGAKKLPESARSLGKSLRIFKEELKGDGKSDGKNETKGKDESAGGSASSK